MHFYNAEEGSFCFGKCAFGLFPPDRKPVIIGVRIFSPRLFEQDAFDEDSGLPTYAKAGRSKFRLRRELKNHRIFGGEY